MFLIIVVKKVYVDTHSGFYTLLGKYCFRKYVLMRLLWVNEDMNQLAKVQHRVLLKKIFFVFYLVKRISLTGSMTRCWNKKVPETFQEIAHSCFT